MERRVSIGLLYVVGDEKYLKHYRKGMAKFLPNFFIPKIRPRIIHNIKGEETEDIIVAGINIKPIDLNNSHDLDGYLQGIREVLTEDISRIYIEGQEKLNYKILKYIEDNINIKVFYGEDIKIKYLPYIMKKIYRVLKDNLEEKEVLILDDNVNRVKKIIEAISKYLGYITVVGLDEQEQNQLYEYILEETGISIFYPYNIEKIAGNYSIIINFMDNAELLFNRLKKHSLVFDFSQGEYEGLKNRPPLIRDFYFIFKNIKVENLIVDTKISSSLFESLSLTQYSDDVLLYAEDIHYTIRSYVDNFMKFKGRF